MLQAVCPAISIRGLSFQWWFSVPMLVLQPCPQGVQPAVIVPRITFALDSIVIIEEVRVIGKRHWCGWQHDRDSIRKQCLERIESRLYRRGINQTRSAGRQDSPNSPRRYLRLYAQWGQPTYKGYAVFQIILFVHTMCKQFIRLWRAGLRRSALFLFALHERIALGGRTHRNKHWLSVNKKISTRFYT